MKCAILLAFVACLACYSVAQGPVKCATPPSWEARIHEFDPAKKFAERAKLSYDGINRRIRRIEELYIAEDRDYYDILWLHDVSPPKEYKLNLKTKQCNVTYLKRPFRRISVPDNATFMGEYTIGSSVPGEGVLVSGWGEKTSGGGRYYGTWSYPSCIPVTDSFKPTGGEDDNFITTNFYDVVLGIQDQNVFLPPKECQNK